MRMSQFVPEIPMIRCDFSLIGSAKYVSQIEENLQWRSTGQTSDWAISIGDVRCNDTSLVTNMVYNLLSEYQWGWIVRYQKEYGVEPVLDLQIHCKESCLPFVVFDRKLICFSKKTLARIRLGVFEEGNTSSYDACREIRLKLFLKGEDLQFEQIEKATGKQATFKKRKGEFPEAVRDQARDCWVYETNKFYVEELPQMAVDLYAAFSGKVNHLICSEISFMEMTVYSNNEEKGISFKAVLPEALISLADELGVPLFFGKYLKGTE